MPIVNRSVDVSQRKVEIQAEFQLAATGVTKTICLVPWPAEIVDIYICARALSGAPTIRVDAHKFTAGSGLTTNTTIMQAALAYPVYGTSGAFRASLGVAGSTQVRVDAGSALVALTAGTNAAADDVVVTIVMKKLQDIVSDFGIST